MIPLPVDKLREAFLEAIETNAHVIVSAPTGSGKSTRLPQYLLQSPSINGRILVLQPRRLAARLLACRVAAERETRPGGETGYLTRYEKAETDKTRLLYVTDGILLRTLLSNRILNGIGAVVFDEFHERSLAADIGLAAVTRLQRRHRPELKLIIMSATLDTASLQKYLDSPILLQSEGRCYPVQTSYLERPETRPVWDQAATAVGDLLKKHRDGDILVFIPVPMR